jgi:hypothetical protein
MEYYLAKAKLKGCLSLFGYPQGNNGECMAWENFGGD